MSVNEFVTFTIQVNNAGIAQQGFGTPLYVSYNATWPELTRTYGQYADVLADFAAGTPEAVIANAVFAQSPHPTTFKIGRGANKPTQQYTIGAITVANSAAYTIQVDGPGVTSTLATYTSDASATTQEIHNGLVTALNAVVGKNYTATFAPLAVLTGIVVTADATTDKLNHTAHGWNTGDGPIQFTNSGGGLPAGIVALTDYYVVKVDADNFKVATSLALALAGTTVDITTNGTGTQTATPTAGALSPILPFLVTASAAGGWFSLAVGSASMLSNKESHADPGVAADLAAIAQADPDWYCLLTLYNSKAKVLAESAWIEANSRIYFACVVDTDALNTGLGNLDTLDALASLGYKRTAGKYHPSPVQAFAAASAGVILPLAPGKWTEAFKTLVGVTPVSITATQRANLRLRRAGTYTTEKGRSITWDGKVFSTVYGYLDITVALDWLQDSVQSAAFGVLVSLSKVAYTDEDIDLIAGAVRGVLADATSDAHEVLDPGDPNDPTNLPPSITFPKVSAISSSTRALRKLPNGTIHGRLQGAVQSIDFIATVTF